MQIPRATYRLQFHEHFRLADALALVPYFHALGISHIYSSPLFKAAPHSVHGYDVCDFAQINPEIGTETDLENLANALHEKKMGLILDIVPNHMGIAAPENLWWQDVLKNGRASRFADYFDINWESDDETLRGKILVPILADDYEKVLARGELQIFNSGGASVPASRPEFILRYFENEFPLAPNSIPKNFSIEKINSNPTALDELIQKQNYRFAHWREGDSKLNYRRFFAVSTLAAVRVEDEKVFNDVHALLKKWLDGLRVDHPDGLRDPENYLRRLRALAPDKWIVVEKILQPQEPMPETWPVQGTTGYDFLNQVNGLFIDSASEKPLTDFYAEFTGEPTGSSKMVQEKKRLVLQTLFTTEVNHLTGLLVQIASENPAYQKFSREQWREALIDLAASFSVYRTYIRAEENFISKNDLQFVKQAAAKAKKLRADLAPELFDFLSDLLVGRDALPRVQADRQVSPTNFNAKNDFVARFQQLTSPAMAKGVEDTVFFCLNRFASFNEVGGDPGKFGVSAEEFHGFCRKQKEHWPNTMLCSSTHDTKRSEDVRARMNLLSEIPGEWRETVLRWSKMNERHRQKEFPDRNMEYLFYQTLVGAWPISRERILAYMEKASCEAKQHTDWNGRNKEYDDALKNFVTATLADKHFKTDLEKFVVSLVEAAQIASLAQTLIKLTAPGVPDIYQGNELWDFSLVDPDNRRLVDFEIRKKLLAAAKNLSAEEIWQRRDEGLPKLWLTQKVLQLRARESEIFHGDYEPIFVRGQKENHVVAFVRGSKAITVVPRFAREIKSDWANVALELPDGNWQNEFTRENFSGETGVEKLFENFPVALLIRE
ncbi:MAG TPA: malto-oligosyltrehalose synthase [Verrucomicrobiae bacterium]|jgi:(1->4)-alpha-D-glucan 1-alpha-D-glucosylmutase